MMNRQYNNQGEKWAALYVRLSRDDENEGDSNSIQHQIEIITKYCNDHEISCYKVYKDGCVIIALSAWFSAIRQENPKNCYIRRDSANFYMDDGFSGTNFVEVR